eukprot:m51a1_g9187 hypothetical protein (468) ;mRNA; r:68910-70313
MDNALLAESVESACSWLRMEISDNNPVPGIPASYPHPTPQQCSQLFDRFSDVSGLARTVPFDSMDRSELCRLVLGRARQKDPRPFPVRVDCTGHADALALGTHARLGERSPVAAVPGCLLRDICRAMAETVVVIDGPSTTWDEENEGLRWSTLPPTLMSTSGRSPDRWSWSFASKHPSTAGDAVTVGCSAAAQWGTGRVLVCGGLLINHGDNDRRHILRHNEYAPSRLFDVASATWVDCAVPKLALTHHIAVNHRGDYYVLGGTDADVGRDVARVLQLASDGSKWVTLEMQPALNWMLSTACSHAGSLWAMANPRGEEGEGEKLMRCDPREPRWDSVEAEGLPEEPHYGATIASCGDSLYSVGGMFEDDGEGTGQLCWKLDARMPVVWQSVAPLTQGRAWCGLACLEGRQCLVALGGQDKCDATTNVGEYASVELYVPWADQWFDIRQLPLSCGNASVVTVAVRTFV